MVMMIHVINLLEMCVFLQHNRASRRAEKVLAHKTHEISVERARCDVMTRLRHRLVHANLPLNYLFSQ